MLCALYARVSTFDQNIEVQLNDLRGYVERAGWTIYKEYSDIGISGADHNRPGLSSMLFDAQSRRFQVLLVHRLDRLARSVMTLSNTANTLTRNKIRLIVTSQGLDTDASNPLAALMLNMMATFAEFERDLLRERIKDGIELARSKGKHLGPPKKVWRRDIAREMLAAGHSYRAIGRKLGVNYKTVQRTLLAEGCPINIPSSKAAKLTEPNGSESE
jgi:DNA invertase Pin-like site-specific DNA recombinase